MISNRWLSSVLVLLIVFSLASCNINVPTLVHITNTPIPPSPSPTNTPIPPCPSPTTTPTVDLSEVQVQESTDSHLNVEDIQGWAVLVAKEDYSDTGDVNLDTGFLNIYQIRSLLDYYGWQNDQILELRDDFGTNDIRKSLDWLEVVAGDEDIVLFYIQGHSSFLRARLDWHTFFADEWDDIPSIRRILIVESCEAGEFTGATSSDPNAQLTVASVAADELTWGGLWEEGMPIVGGVFSHYFLEAFTDPTADQDGDGFISIQESASAAEKHQRRYMHEIIFPVPEFLDQYHTYGIFPEGNPDFPHVVVSDGIGEPVFLDLWAYQSK